MSLNVRWSETVKGENYSDEEFGRWAEFVAFNMMFCGVQEITSAKEFAFRIVLWDTAINGEANYSVDDLVKILTPYVGTTANVTPKTFHSFLTGDVKRIAKEKGFAS